MMSLLGSRLVFRATALLILAGGIAQAQNPPFYFVVRGRVANGDQFDPGWPFNFSTATGGGSTSRAIPNTSGYGNQNYTGWGTMTVSASIGAASLSATYQGNMDPANASRGCGYYGCGWTPNADTQYSGIDVYVRGNPGTQYHIVQTDSGNLDASVTKTSACQNNYANAQAHASWAGVNGSATATSEHGTGGYCGVPVPKSGSASVGLSYTRDGTSTTPTLTFNGQTYSYAYSAQTVISLSIYAEQDPSFTAHSGGSVTVNVTGNLVRPSPQPPTARITGPSSVAVNSAAQFDGSTSSDPDGSIVEYRWTIQTETGTISLLGQSVNYSWASPGTYQVTLTVTDDDGLTATTSASVAVGLCAVALAPPSASFQYGGGTGTVTVTPSAPTCSWTATSQAPWITVDSGASGTGNGAVNYSVTANPTNTLRASSILIGGQTFPVSQQGTPCAFSLSPASATYGPSGGTGSFTINTGSQCDWVATSAVPWLRITSRTSGRGSGFVTYTVDSHSGTSDRSGDIVVADQRHSVQQRSVGKPDLTCRITEFFNFIPDSIPELGVQPGLETRGGWWALNLVARVTILITNGGATASSPTRLGLRLRIRDTIIDRQLTTVSIPSIPAGQTYTLSRFGLAPLGAGFDRRFFGSTLLIADADYDNAVDEADEVNNSFPYDILLVDPRPARYLLPNQFATEEQAADFLRSGGFYNTEPLAWTKPLEGSPIWSRRDGQTKPAFAFRIDALIRRIGPAYRVLYQGQTFFGEPSPLFFTLWSDLGYVAGWHDRF